MVTYVGLFGRMVAGLRQYVVHLHFADEAVLVGRLGRQKHPRREPY